MAIINRNLHLSEQEKDFSLVNAGTANGVTLTLGVVPWQGNIMGGQLAAWGLSGAPTYAVAINRFIAGTGFTTIVVATGTSNAPAEFGTSGAGAFGSSLFGASGMVMAAQGSTLMQVLPNDVLTVTSGGGSSAAVKGLAISVTIQPAQDIKYRYATGV